MFAVKYDGERGTGRTGRWERNVLGKKRNTKYAECRSVWYISRNYMKLIIR